MAFSPIIEIEQLLKIHKNSEVLLFDASTGKEAKNDYEEEHLQGAYFVDLSRQLADINADVSFGGRHPLPTVAGFAQTLTDLGISKNSHVIIYDDANSSNAAARFWWMLKSYGHEKVQVLNGGLNQAKKHYFPLSSKTEIVAVALESYEISRWNLPVVTIDEVEKATRNSAYLIVDVRAKERYDGITEPIDLIAGHIPAAVNIPLTENIDENGLFLSTEKLKQKYSQKFSNISSENIIVHCGSGVTACHTLLALAYAELEIPKLYVGSWSEWSRNNKPIETAIG